MTAREGGDGYEEKPIESKDGDSATSSRHTTSQPLFEQLRANKEKEEAEREDFQRSVMRGTLALDEEDCAHLDAIQRQRQEREQMIQKQTDDELAAFRTARELRRIEQENEDDKGDVQEISKPQTAGKIAAALEKPAANKPKFPQIVLRKRRKSEEDDKKDTEPKKTKSDEANEMKKTSTSRGLDDLFTGYGSDSDSD